MHIANLSALILYGDPKIDEPLSFAWRRCLESAEWQKRREKYGGWDEYGRDTCGDPFVSFGATRIAKYFREHFLPDLPGVDEVEKFSLIFKKAPPWLLWFTYGDADAQILGIKLPDLSTVNRFIRDPQNFGSDELAPGPFECRLRADGSEDQSAIWTKMIKRKHKNEANEVTPRERKRIRRICEKYKNVSKPLPDQVVMTRPAVTLNPLGLNDDGSLQLRGVLVMIGGGDELADGGAGDNTNVNQTFQPAGLFSLANSP